MGNSQRLTARVLAVGALASALVVGVSHPRSSAYAQNADDEKPAPDAGEDGDINTNPRRAKQLYELGKRLFVAGEFREGAKTFAESFDYDPKPGALFNQGRCLEEANDKSGAISSYKRYLALEPDGDASDEARTRALALERELDLEGGVGSSGGSNSAGTGAGKDGDRQPGANLKLGGYILGAIAVASIGTGTVFAMRASSIEDEVSGHTGTWTESDIARVKDGERADTLGKTFLAVGAVAAVGGVVIYYLGHRKSTQSKRVTVTPVVTPTAAAASISISF